METKAKTRYYSNNIKKEYVKDSIAETNPYHPIILKGYESGCVKSLIFVYRDTHYYNVVYATYDFQTREIKKEEISLPEEIIPSMFEVIQGLFYKGKKAI